MRLLLPVAFSTSIVNKEEYVTRTPDPDPDAARYINLDMALTLAKVDRMCHDMLVDDRNPLGDEARTALTEIQRVVSHRAPAEARSLLRFREKVRAEVDAYAGSYHVPGDDLYAGLVEILNEEA